MKANREKFKQFVTEQLKDYDEWREASPDGYAEIITDEAVKLFYQPAVVGRSEQLKAFVDWWHGLSQEELAWYEGRYVEVFLSL
jgi:hypothetical protein